MTTDTKPTIVDILRDNPEPLPRWLDDTPAGFDRDTFFASRTVYYPGSGNDGQPVKLCSLSHAAHSFIYVDQSIDRDTLHERLNDPVIGFRDYAIEHQESVTRNGLRPNGWTPHVSEEEARNSANFQNSFVEPFGWLVILHRQSGGDDHGPQRLAILFIGGDGFATYDALYCQRDGTPPPFLVVIQDHGFGGSYDRFDKDGLLDRIARRTEVRPQFLLVGEPSKPWSDYANTGACPDSGGMHSDLRVGETIT